ncbi:serine/threonine protein kinase [Planctomicrobium sp. SH668]|uniref:serine/threonine protein kinase n=1 Tax=Planctomicrobium sp. SH668 TaxID=3448126 RepID=UPI003F5BF418
MANLQTFDSVEQTVVIPLPAELQRERGTKPVSAPKVALLEGSSPDFTTETNRILNTRLRYVSMILFLGYFAFWLKGHLVPNATPFEQRIVPYTVFTAVTATMGLIWFRLSRNCKFAFANLRSIEILIFGLSAAQFFFFGLKNIRTAAALGYLPSVIASWTLLIFTYALFIPNTWKRSLWVIVPLACGPSLTLVYAFLADVNVSRLIRETTEFHHVFLEAAMAMTFVTIIATVGVKLIRGLRTEVFEAKQLGQYRLKQQLGRGGMGEVYLAEHVMLKRPCAIKIIRPEKAGDPGTLARFEQEVRSTARLTHWNTIEIFDFGRTEDGTFYYVMEYLHGMTIEQIVEMHGAMPPERVIHLLSQTCDALGEAHAEGLVHRDIKPANIFAARRGGTYDVSKLLDFGLVRDLDDDVDLRLTQVGTVTGSPLYMSPEQARGDSVDARSDIYSMGCVAYAMLTGRTPFVEDRAVKLILAHASKEVERPSKFRADIPADLESVVLRCLEKSPEDRFESASALRDALLDCRDAGKWNRHDATDWWTNFGCPKKKTLDAMISAGVPLTPDMVNTLDIPKHAGSTI